MKSIIIKSFTLVAIAATLLSFNKNFGGEGFKISLNGKVLLQQFGKDMDVVKTLQLQSTSPGDQLTIQYYHCGRVGKNRIVSIKDGHNKLVKEFRFKNAPTAMDDMSCAVKDILSLTKGSNDVLKLYYSSSELPKGRQLATVYLESGNNKVQP